MSLYRAKSGEELVFDTVDHGIAVPRDRVDDFHQALSSADRVIDAHIEGYLWVHVLERL